MLRLLYLAAIAAMAMALYTADPPALDAAILLALWAALSGGVIFAAWLLLWLLEDRGLRVLRWRRRIRAHGAISHLPRRRVRPVAAGGAAQPAEPAADRRRLRLRGVGPGLLLAVALVGCEPGTTSSGAGYALEAAIGIAGGVAAGTMLGKSTKDPGLPPSEPLSTVDQQAIALAGGADGPYLSACTRIWRHAVDTWPTVNGGASGQARGGVAWSDGSCSIGPGYRDDPVIIGKKFLHEAAHQLHGSSEAAANEFERNASRELGI